MQRPKTAFINPQQPFSRNKLVGPLAKGQAVKIVQGKQSIAQGNWQNEIQKAQNSSKSLEAEYIKSLQQQIYLFELENVYLRDKLGKNDDEHPQKQEEEDKMREYAKNLKDDADGLQLELERKDAHIELLTKKLKRLSEKLEQESGLRKDQLEIFTQDILKEKSEKDTLTRDGLRKETEIEELKSELRRQRKMADQTAHEVSSLKALLDEETKRCKTLEKNLLDQKKNFIKFEETMRMIEADYVDGFQKAELMAQKKVQREMTHSHDISKGNHLDDFSRQQLGENARLANECAALRREAILLKKKLDHEISGKMNAEQLLVNEEQASEILQNRQKNRVNENKMLNAQASNSPRWQAHLKLQTRPEITMVESQAFKDRLDNQLEKQLHDKEVLLNHISDLKQQVSAQSREITELRKIVKRRIASDEDRKCTPPETSQPSLIMHPSHNLHLSQANGLESNQSEHTNEQVNSATFSEPIRSLREVEEEPIQPEFKAKPERHY